MPSASVTFQHQPELGNVRQRAQDVIQMRTSERAGKFGQDGRPEGNQRASDQPVYIPCRRGAFSVRQNPRIRGEGNQACTSRIGLRGDEILMNGDAGS